ncbi:MAG: cache domain-containing protein [Nitrospirota bacterium]|nr:cache domain-containing protein [Nitrospirota bacterium]
MFTQIGKRMLLWVLTLVIIPLGTVSLITYYQTRQTLIEQIYTTLNVTADSFKKQLDLFIKSKENRAREIAVYKFLRDTLSDLDQQEGKSDRFTELNQYLEKEKIPLDPDIYDILIFNKEGKLVSSSHDISKSIKGTYKYFLNGKEGLAFQSIESIDGERLFSYSCPIKDKNTGDFLGVATVSFIASAIDTILTDEIKRLWGAHMYLSDLSEKGMIFIVDRNKTIIASSSKFFLGKMLDVEPVNRAFGSKLESIGEFTGILGKDRLGASLYLEKLGWVVIASVSKKEALSPVLKIVHIGFLRIGIGMVAVMILAIIIAQRIARPILHVANTAERITEGHWDERVVVKYKKGEIAQLARAFNEMVETLQKSFRALRHSERLKENIIATIPSALIVLNRAFKVTSVNKGFCEMFDITIHEVVGKPVDDVLNEIGISKEGRNAISHGDCFSDLECECQSPKMGQMVLKLSMTDMQDVEEVVLVIDNIKELK